jgi:hypothetical protein
MSNLIFCPHTDDAVFSLGSYILNNKNFIIASAFAGIPTDDIGYKKHTVLRGEHKKACDFVSAKEINGNLLDDVYGKQDKNLLVTWIEQIIRDHDTSEVLNLNVFVPLGIHHPDHIFLSELSKIKLRDIHKVKIIVKNNEKLYILKMVCKVNNYLKYKYCQERVIYQHMDFLSNFFYYRSRSRLNHFIPSLSIKSDQVYLT